MAKIELGSMLFVRNNNNTKKKLLTARGVVLFVGIIDKVFGMQIAAQRIRSIHLQFTVDWGLHGFGSGGADFNFADEMGIDEYDRAESPF